MIDVDPCPLLLNCDGQRLIPEPQESRSPFVHCVEHNNYTRDVLEFVQLTDVFSESVVRSPLDHTRVCTAVHAQFRIFFFCHMVCHLFTFFLFNARHWCLVRSVYLRNSNDRQLFTVGFSCRRTFERDHRCCTSPEPG